MLFVDCPLCDEPAVFHDASDTLECAACAVQLELALDMVPPGLATAA